MKVFWLNRASWFLKQGLYISVIYLLWVVKANTLLLSFCERMYTHLVMLGKLQLSSNQDNTINKDPIKVSAYCVDEKMVKMH